MNLKILILTLFIISLSFCVFANPISLDPEKEFYYFGETFQGNLYIDSSVEEDIKITDFHLESNDTNFNVYPSLLKMKNYTYLYFDIPYNLEEGNYSLVIENVLYVKDDILVQEDQKFDLNLKNRNGSILSIDPGIIFLNVNNKNYFDINVKNPSLNGTSFNITGLDNFLSSSKSNFYVNQGSSKDIKISVYVMFVDVNESSFKISYGDLFYEIPVYFEGVGKSEGIVIPSEEGSLGFLEDGFNISINFGESVPGYVKISNEKNTDVSNVEIKLSDELKDLIDLEFSNIDKISSGETKKDHIYINEKKNIKSGKYSGFIDLYSGGSVQDSIPVTISVLEELVDLTNETDDGPKDEVPNSADNRWVTVLIIILILVVVGLLILIKYKKSKKKVTSFFGK